MSETLLAVIIGGLLAIAGSAVTQIILFWLQGRREKKERRLRLLENMGYLGADDDDDSGEFTRLTKKVAEDYDDELVAILTGALREGIDRKQNREQAKTTRTIQDHQ